MKSRLYVGVLVLGAVMVALGCGGTPKADENTVPDQIQDQQETEEQHEDAGPQQKQVCFCTDQHTNVACEPCDNEPNVSVCFHHDEECQVSAKNAGEKNPKEFFCTTHPAPGE